MTLYTNSLITENIYGHAKRLEWIASNLKQEDLVLELGCGTGYMITLPLSKAGYKITGVDLDQASIQLGQEIFKEEGLAPELLRATDLADLESTYDVIVASEILEHVSTQNLPHLLDVIRQKLNNQGMLLVTVPNGYGWFELESLLWFHIGLGRLLEATHVTRVVNRTKEAILGFRRYKYPSTVADSPHLQRYTYNSVRTLLQNNGFEIQSATGSVLFAGPFSNLFFTGLATVMKLNNWLGSKFPRIASGYFIVCKRSV